LISLAGGTAWAQPASQVDLDPIAMTSDTGEKPQSKVWRYAGAWWSVLPNSQGTWLRKLVGTQWTDVLSLSSDTDTQADCKDVGDVVHILLFSGTTSELVSVEYNSGTGLYETWSLRPTASAVTLDSGVETATIDIDSNDRMWLASDGSTTINVRYSDSPYSSWSGPITLETGVSTDDISVVTALPNGTIGVLWSNQTTKRFGFKTHTDGADPNTWSADEVPASQSANDGVGGGMADDHLNVAVASDGTLYAVIKTSYTSGYPLIGLLVRRPGGTWDDLYEVSQSGTRGIVLLNEWTGTVSAVYTDGGIVLKESPTSSIAFGSAVTLMTGSLNNATSTKRNIADEVVILASSSGSASGVLLGYETDCLAGWWPMEEGSGTTIIDASGEGNNGNLFGAPTWSTGVIGSALDLDGTNDYALVPDAAKLDITDEITLAAWVKPEMQGTQYLVKKAQSGIDGYELSLSTSGSGKAFARLNRATSSNTYRVDALTDYPKDGNTWQHLAMTYDGAMIRFYVDGVKEDSVAATISIGTNALPLGIGAQSDGDNKFQGMMDDVQVHCRALSEAEIQNLLSPPNRAPIALCQNVTVQSETCPAPVDPSLVDNGSFDPDGDPITLALDPPGPYAEGVTFVDLVVSDGSLVTRCTATITIECTTPDPECLAGFWAMEEDGGTVVVDSSSQGNDGDLFGSPAWATGVHGLSLVLDGSSDYALVPDAASLDITDAITLAAWIKPEKVGTQYVVKKAIQSGTDGYELSLSSNGKAFGRLNQATSVNAYRVDATTDYPTDGATWMHLAMTYDGAMVRFYVDGVKEDSVAAAISIAANALDLGIGAQSNGASLFQGAIDEARVYCRALSEGEIEALVQPPANDPPVAVCQDVSVPSGQTCPVVVDPSQVDDGSFDPDGDPITLALDPPGPYWNGVTAVDLIVSAGSLADTCSATITVDCEDPPECLAGLWYLDEGGGTTVVDTSGNDNDGAIFGAPGWITGKIGLALDLNGSSDYALVPDATSLDITDEITLAAWVKPGTQDTQYLIKKAIINNTDGYELSLSSSGLVFVRFNQAALANGLRIDSATPYPTDGNTWMHLAATYDGSTIRMYVNGVEESSLPATFSIAANNLDLGIGAQSDGDRLFQGALDDVRVHCRALNPTEIEALANCAVVPDSIDFGVVSAGESLDDTFTVINLGSGVLNGDISESCAEFSIVSGAGPYSLAPAESLIVTVRFSPTIDGEQTCVVETGNSLCDDVHLTGYGVSGPQTPEISIVPAADTTNCSSNLTYQFYIDYGGSTEIRGYDVTFTVDTTVVKVNNHLTDFTEGTYLSSFGTTTFYSLDPGAGTYVASCAILGGTTGATGSGDLFDVMLTPVAGGTSAITITNVDLRDLDNVPIAAVWTGGSILVDCTPPTMEPIAEAEGQYYNTAPSFSNFGFDDDVALDTGEYRIDAGGWVALFTNLNLPEYNDDGWTLPGFAGLSEGSHTVYFRVSDMAGNQNGEGTPDTYIWQFFKDTVAPAPPTEFVAMPGHNKTHLTWTNPTGDASWTGVEIRRTRWYDYPQYSTPAPSYPANETEGEFVVQSSGNSHDDDPLVPPTDSRDIYYYSAFSYDMAGNYSVLGVDASDRATNYWLGDIDSTGTVESADLVTFSGAYASSEGGPGWVPEADFGPSEDYSRFGIPLPDDIVEFEDLMIFAMNYGNVTPAGAPGQFLADRQVPLNEQVAFSFEQAQKRNANGTVQVSIVLDNVATVLKGMRLTVDYGVGNHLVRVDQGALVRSDAGAFLGTMDAEPGRVCVDIAALGIGRALEGSGEVARLIIRPGEGDAVIVRLVEADLRDIDNQGDVIEATETADTFVPTVSSLHQNRPNPFNPTTTVSYDVAEPGVVSIRIYNVSGQLVRALVDGFKGVGRYEAVWDGRDNSGATVSTGVYFYRMTAPGFASQTNKMVLLK